MKEFNEIPSEIQMFSEDVFYKQLQRNHRLLVNHQLKEVQQPNWLGRCEIEQRANNKGEEWGVGRDQGVRATT